MALALTGPVTKEQIKSTCYYNIESSTPSTIDWDNVIGQGTYGIILGTIIDDNWVVKIANKTRRDAIKINLKSHKYNLSIALLIPIFWNKKIKIKVVTKIFKILYRLFNI